jgi:RNA polymerase sigma factor (sigma-70 family)
MTPSSLREQVAAARSGNREAFATLVGHYQGLVSATTLNIVGDFQQSEDIAQETFLIAWKQLAELSDPSKFPAWLCGIARNCSKNWLRRQERNPLAQSTEISDIAAAETESPSEADAQLVWRSLADIPETYREPMLMFYRHGAKIADIADALELTEEAVRQRLSRGRKLLKSEVERTVEKTLAATRPDTAFTLAVLAAIPLSASVGCQATSKSIGLGVSTMSGLGFFGVAFAVLVSLVLTVIPTLLLAAVCFYAFWFAVKNSPTLRTRRFAISAALDMNILFWLIPFVLGWISIWASSMMQSRRDWIFELVFFFKSFPLSVQLFLSSHLPVLLVFGAFVVYIVLRWRQILYEDKIAQEPGASAPGYVIEKTESFGDSGHPGADAPGSCATDSCALGKMFDREINFVRNLVNGYRNSPLTPHGLCVKRNIVLGLIVVFLIHHIVSQALFYWRLTYGPSWEPSSGQFAWLAVECTARAFFSLGIQVVFFYFVSKAIGISQDETALEQSPPKISLAQWSDNELCPKGRRQILIDAFFLMVTVPLMLILAALGGGITQENLFDRNSLMGGTYPMSIAALIELHVALVVLTVLWCSRNPTKRLLSFSRLFLVGGLLAFGYIEYQPLRHLATLFYLSDFFSWWAGSGVFEPGIFELLKMYSAWHLTAMAFLVYSLLAAAFCYFLQPVTSKHID